MPRLMVFAPLLHLVHLQACLQRVVGRLSYPRKALPPPVEMPPTRIRPLMARLLALLLPLPLPMLPEALEPAFSAVAAACACAASHQVG